MYYNAFVLQLSSIWNGIHVLHLVVAAMWDIASVLVVCISLCQALHGLSYEPMKSLCVDLQVLLMLLSKHP